MLTLVSKNIDFSDFGKILGTYGSVTHQIARIDGFLAQDLGNYAV